MPKTEKTATKVTVWSSIKSSTAASAIMILSVILLVIAAITTVAQVLS